MFTDMEKWVEIRRDVLVGGKSKRQVQRETGLAWKTLEKILTHSSPPGYRRTRPYPKPKLGPYLDRIARIIEADRDVPRKQRHTAKRIYERIRDEGYQGRYTQVKAAVRAIKRTKREVFFPLVHRPGEAQVDLGEALVKEAGVLSKIVFFVMVTHLNIKGCTNIRDLSPVKGMRIKELHIEGSGVGKARQPPAPRQKPPSQPRPKEGGGGKDVF